LAALEAQMDTLKRSIDELSSSQKASARASFEQYCEALQYEYEKAEAEYDTLMQLLKNAYDEEQDFLASTLDYEKSKLQKDIEIIRQELDKIRATRAAAMEAQLKEREIKEQRAFYSLPINDIDLADIKALEAIKARLSKPRVLSMLIWQTYFQKPMTQLCNNVLCSSTICGIYKITN
jgi:hypothetical protein